MISDIKRTLWSAADKLRANMDAAEYKHLVLGLIFLKCISDTFAGRQDELRAAAKQPDIGKRIEDALTAIEAKNPKLKGILDKRYGRAQWPDGKLGELVDLVSTIGFGDDANVARDILGQVYEYFLGQFAGAESKKGGQFYTPAGIVKTMAAVLTSHKGQEYDPCCGSGGMFVQSEKFIEAHGGKIVDVSMPVVLG